jgi:hypothetical protein
MSASRRRLCHRRLSRSPHQDNSRPKTQKQSDTRSIRVAGAMTPHGGASISGRRRPPAHRSSSSDEENNAKCGMNWEWEKKPVRVKPNRFPLYTPPPPQRDASPRAGPSRDLRPSVLGQQWAKSAQWPSAGAHRGPISLYIFLIFFS